MQNMEDLVQQVLDHEEQELQQQSASQATVAPPATSETAQEPVADEVVTPTPQPEVTPSQQIAEPDVNPRIPIGKAAEMIGVSIDTLRRWDKSGKITSRRSPGGHRYFLKEDLDDVFGTRYERTAETQSPETQVQETQAVDPPALDTIPNLGQTQAPNPTPVAQEKPSYVTVEEEVSSEPVQPPVHNPAPTSPQVDTNPESALLQEQDRVEVRNILEPTDGLVLPEQAGSKLVKTLETIGIIGIVIVAVADAVLAYLYFTSSNLLTPLQ